MDEKSKGTKVHKIPRKNFTIKPGLPLLVDEAFFISLCRCKNVDDNMYDSVLGFKYWDNNFVSTCRLTYNGEAYEMDGWKGATATCKSDKGCKISDLKTNHPWIAQKNIR